jgi:dTDP-4-amino-4,6-dideoxygalactose transaminase
MEINQAVKEIKFVDLNRQYQSIKTEVDAAMQKVLDKGDYILGGAVKEFEENFAKFCNTKYAVGVDNGTTALELALKTLNVGPGDEVITVANTFIATTLAISAVGATVVLVDAYEDTQLIDVSQIEKAITSKTKAIMPVHLFGQTADMDAIMEIAKKHELYVVEDCSQAHGAKHNGKICGTFGDINCFSLYPGKNLGAYGDAGILVTNNEDHYKKLMMMRNYGSIVKYHHDFLGKNSRLDTLQAAVLNVKLRHLDKWNAKRNENVIKYNELLKGVGDLILPTTKSYNYAVHHLYVCRTKRRDELMKYLNSKGVQCVIHYPIPVHLQKAYADLNKPEGSFPATEKLAKEILSLPMHPDLTQDDIDYVVNTVKEFFNS